MKRGNIHNSRTLRRNQTNAEKKLWDLLRNRQLLDVKFRRQFSVGHYIIDFYAPQYRLGVEADGGQHYDEDGKQKDEIRTEELSNFGIKILRFSDYEILNNIEGIIEIIQEEIQKLTIPPHLNPLPERERRGRAG